MNNLTDRETTRYNTDENTEDMENKLRNLNINRIVEKYHVYI